MVQQRNGADKRRKTVDFTELDAQRSIDFIEGEEEKHVTGRHWIVLVGRLLVPLVLILFCAGLAFYRSIGGTFLAVATNEPLGFDGVNMLLAGALALLALFYFYSALRQPKKRNQRQWALGVGMLLIALIYFRYRGGRIFSINPVAEWRLYDSVNIALLVFILLLLVYCVFIFINWANDQLILTNKRVIMDDDMIYIPRLLQSQNQEQLWIEDIQSVTSITKTYPQHYLKYGTIIVKSATPGRDIEFKAAIRPKQMQEQIDGMLKQTRKMRSEEDYKKKITTSVYNTSQSKPKVEKPEFNKPFFLRQLYGKEPRQNQETNEYQWRLRNLFTFPALFMPFLTLFFGWTTLFIAAGDEMPNWAAVLLALSMLPIAYFLWITWEDQNPEYDAEKKQYIWRPHWLYHWRALVGPLIGLAVMWIVLLMAARLDLLGPGWFGLTMTLVLLVFFGWAAWEIEDYRNDVYILAPDKVIDVEKKPFGPEDRKNADLTKLQNVSFKTTLISNLFGYGDVLLETAGGGGGKFTFNHVPNPRGVTGTINEYIAQARKVEKDKSLNDVLNLLKYYHEEQVSRNEIRIDTSSETKAES